MWHFPCNHGMMLTGKPLIKLSGCTKYAQEYMNCTNVLSTRQPLQIAAMTTVQRRVVGQALHHTVYVAKGALLVLRRYVPCKPTCIKVTSKS